MTKELFPPVVNEAGLFTRHDALADGWTDRDLHRSQDIYRVIHGVYALRDVPLTHELKCRAVAMRFPPDSIITGASAATLHGIPLARPHERAEVIVSGVKYVNRRYGTRCWTVRTWPFEHKEWNEIRVATLERAAFDLLARNPFKHGVANVDALIQSGCIDADRIGKFLEGRHDHGIARARSALGLVDGRAESIPESVLRITLALDGLIAEPQVTVWDPHGQFVARVDLAFRRQKVAVEYDGAWHGDPEQVLLDERRRDRLRANGWIVIVVTADRLRNAPQGVVNEVRAALVGRD